MSLPQVEFQRIVGVVSNWLDEAPKNHREEFINMSKEDLIKYHHSLGRDIRNEFGLWQYAWTPQIENGFDMSPDHPDAVSMRVIETVWENSRNARNIL